MEKRKIVKKRRSYFSCFSVIAVILLVAAGTGLYANNWYSNAIFSPNSTSTETVAINVATGDSLTGLSEELETKGLIKSKDALRLYLRLNDIAPQIKYGSYLIAKNLTVPQIIEILENGVYKPALWVTIKEGLRHEEIAEVLNSALSEGGAQKLFGYEEFIRIIETPSNYTFSQEVADFLTLAKPADKPLEGFLFPDTYRIDSDATTMEVVEMFLKNFKQRLADNQIDVRNVTTNQSNLSSFYEVLTLASIIEKEASATDDAAEISGVFHNRLADSYPLQSDATINYFTGKNDPGVSFEDRFKNHPFNTYDNPGVTPTPIDNPGIRTIKAALNPNKNNYYFFRHDSQGNVHYSVDYNQHQNSVYNYP